jgi:hypothetical protein
VIPPKVRNSLATNYKDTQVNEIPDKEFKKMTCLKKINEFQENIKTIQ